MDNDNISALITDIKNHLVDNDGEAVYSGAVIPAKAGIYSRATKGLDSGLRGNDKIAQLEHLRTQTIGDCHLCPLGDTRKKIAFGVGNPDAQVMFVGEGPGYDEDRLGEPFVGKAGQLLDKIMAAIQLNRTSVYIANIVKCHPMKNPLTPEARGNDRAPEQPEMDQCRPFLLEQIRIIQPKYIVALGAVAARSLLNTTEGITKLRGKIVDVAFFPNGAPIPVLPTYHPAALLRNELLKKDVWDDMKLLRHLLAQ